MQHAKTGCVVLRMLAQWTFAEWAKLFGPIQLSGLNGSLKSENAQTRNHILLGILAWPELSGVFWQVH
jgi:hypothetical protein